MRRKGGQKLFRNEEQIWFGGNIQEHAIMLSKQKARRSSNVQEEVLTPFAVTA